VPRRLLRGDGIAGLLEVAGLGLGDIGIHNGVQWIEILAEPQGVELLAALREFSLESLPRSQ
jgi:hypothetical protein